MFEADDLQSQGLLHFGHVRFPGCLQQWVTFELIYTEEKEVNDVRLLTWVYCRILQRNWSDFWRRQHFWTNSYCLCTECIMYIMSVWVKDYKGFSQALCVYMSRCLLCENSQVSLSLSSGVGAMSTALLLWQFSRVGSAPWLSSKEQTSTRFLDAASWRGVNCHKSMAFTQAPCCREKHTSEHRTCTGRGTNMYKNLIWGNCFNS